MKQTIVETCACMGGVKDSPQGRVNNVKILGFESANRRRYTQEAISSAVKLYEGIAVNLDHPKDSPAAPRSFFCRFGKLVGVHMEGDGLRGDLLYNPEHPAAKPFAWYAKHMPEAVGLSHNAVGEGRQEGATFVVETIHSVRSVDLVAEPATTKGLFEAMEEDQVDMGAPAPGLDAAGPAPEEPGYEAQLGSLVAAIVNDPDLSKEEKREKVLTALDLLDDDEETPVEDMPSDEVPMDDETPVEDEEPEEEELEDDDVEEQLNRLWQLEKRERVRELAEELKVPHEVLTTTLVEAASNLTSEAKVKKFLQEQAQAARAKKPISSGKGVTKRVPVEEFISQLSREDD